MSNNIDLIQILTDRRIYSSITSIDVAKNVYYDFSNIVDKEALLYPDKNVTSLFQQLLDSNLLIHMKRVIIPWLFSILPSNLNCDIDKHIHNITIDADGTLRLCLRIRGLHSPTYKIEDIFDSHYIVKEEVREKIRIDKKLYCQRCNHTCLMMSKFIDMQPDKLEYLVHTSTI